MIRLNITLNRFPHLKKHWWRGSLPEGFSGLDHKFLLHCLEMTKLHKTAYSEWYRPFLGAVVVCHPDTAKVVLKHSHGKAPNYRRFLVDWLGDGLLISSGPKWFRNRRLLTPAFHFHILKEYTTVFNKASVRLIDKLEPTAQKGGTFDVFNTLSPITLDVILKCAFSSDFETDTKMRHPYVKGVYRLGHLWNKRWSLKNYLIMLVPFLYKHTSDGAEFYQLCDYVHREADCIINRRKKELLTGNPLKKKHLDFLDILLMAKDENGIGLTTKEIRAEVDTFMLAGHDTTGAAISWTMYALAKYPEYQETVRNEVDAILEDTGNALEWEDLSKLQLLTLFMKETMRLYAPVPFISRCLDDDVVIDGKKVLAGVNVRLCIWAMHRHPDIWGEDVEEFKPERFHPDKMKDFDSFGYIPFSAGPRNCIGQNFALAEEKVLLARLLHKYELSLPDDTPEIIPSVRLVLKVEGDDIKLRLGIRK